MSGGPSREIPGRRHPPSSRWVDFPADRRRPRMLGALGQKLGHRRPQAVAPVHGGTAMKEEVLLQMLATLRDALHAETKDTRSSLVPGPNCFPLSRLLRAAKKNDWTPVETSHLATCAYCRRSVLN